MKSIKVDILNGKLNSTIWIVVIPIIITNFIDGIYGIMDSLFVANVGSLVVASVTFVSPIQDTLNSIGLGVSLAGCSLIAQLIGKKDVIHSKKMMGQLILFEMIIGIVVSLSIYFCAN